MGLIDLNLTSLPDRVIVLCRPGFESDVVQEIVHRLEAFECYGYPKLEPNNGFVEFVAYDNESLLASFSKLDPKTLIFCRDIMLSWQQLKELDTADRVSGLIELVAGEEAFADVKPWVSDTNDGKSLAKLSKKLCPPFKKALIDDNRLKASSNWLINLMFTETDSAYIGVSLKDSLPRWPNGIAHLRFPSLAPSRSTLKLEEAFLEFLTKRERESFFGLGKTAVDLGACPGGWTYQLVKRDVFVYAIDNGAMADSLMKTGLVEHIKADGFVFTPPVPVTWLVCDMIEQPRRIARLMAEWLANGHAERAMFNLKLPMKKRYQEVQDCIALISEILGENSFDLLIKQLYHDREEVTCYLTRS
ncbi:MAG: 23S rRNA (cytidine(2498)-2'-O)-methyltransferase RlmM [Gammaproteobacteria bacterium]|nr:23S rRNA (cytidine(2498)-2'-O)-methyltransferase RlmM [Gammaproteobacteria bacterium]